MAELELLIGILGSLNVLLIGLIYRLTSKVAALEVRLKFISDQIETRSTFKKRK